MADALAALKSDHERIFALMNALTGGAGNPGGDRSTRQQLADQLIIEVSRHEAVEELLFWPLVRQRLQDGDELAQTALQQEGGGKRLLHELNHMSPGAEEFETLTFYLASRLRDHINYEENQIWPKLQLHVAASELEELGAKIEAARRLAPTRPHPYTPARPGVLGTLGTAAAVVDRMRDAVTGRGK